MTGLPTTGTTTTPIVCTLGPGAYADRSRWLAELNRTFLRTYQQSGTTLELIYSPAGLAQVRELVRQETECCAFLGFELSEGTDFVRLRITAPSGTQGRMSVLLAPFLAGAARRRHLPSKGIVTGAAVVAACGICCALPLASSAVALTSAGSVLLALAGNHRWVSVLALAGVAGGWFIVGWRSVRERRPPARSTLGAMVLVMLFGALR